MSALLSFLGGSAFRMIWGELSSYFSKRQEHKLEVERMKLQGELDAKQHERNLASQRQQAELGYKTIAVQADADMARTETEAWRDAVARMQAPSGVQWVDAWNASIRPAFGTVALILFCYSEMRHMAVNGWAVTAWGLDLIAVVVGFFFADRSLKRVGK